MIYRTSSVLGCCSSSDATLPGELRYYINAVHVNKFKRQFLKLPVIPGWVLSVGLQLSCVVQVHEFIYLLSIFKLYIFNAFLYSWLHSEVLLDSRLFQCGTNKDCGEFLSYFIGHPIAMPNERLLVRIPRGDQESTFLQLLPVNEIFLFRFYRIVYSQDSLVSSAVKQV